VNRHNRDQTLDIKQSFLQGGYYKYESHGYLFISLNTLLWDKEVEDEDLHGKDWDMLYFLKNALNDVKDK